MVSHAGCDVHLLVMGGCGAFSTTGSLLNLRKVAKGTVMFPRLSAVNKMCLQREIIWTVSCFKFIFLSWETWWQSSTLALTGRYWYSQAIFVCMCIRYRVYSPVDTSYTFTLKFLSWTSCDVQENIMPIFTCIPRLGFIAEYLLSLKILTSKKESK